MIKGLMLINNGVEDLEALATKGLLTRAGLKVDSFTLENDYLIKTAYNTLVRVDLKVDEVNYKDYDFLILPGGKHVFKWVLEETLLDEIINYFNDNKKLIAAICAAPLFLNKLSILNNKNFTCFPSVSREIKGNYLKSAKVVRDNNIITSRSAATIYDFSFEIIDYLLGSKALESLKDEIVVNLS